MEHLLSCKGLTEQEAEFAIKRATKGNPGFVQTDVDDLTVRFSMSKHLPVSSRIAKVSLIENVNEVVGVAIVDGYDVLGEPETEDDGVNKALKEKDLSEKSVPFANGWTAFFKGASILECPNFTHVGFDYSREWKDGWRSAKKAELFTHLGSLGPLVR